jgi:integrase/recombinase XerD
MKHSTALKKYVELMTVQGCSESTIINQKIRMNRFFDFIKEKGVTATEAITIKELNEYQIHLYYMITRYGTPMTVESQITYLSAVLSFYKALTRAKILLHNPALDLELPRRKKKLPEHCYSNKDLQRIYSGIDEASVYGYQFRTMLEVLASTGVRVTELCNIRLNELDLEDGFLTVKQGKGKKDRKIPMGLTACAYCKEFIEKVRPLLVKSVTGDHLFITKQGRAYDRYSVAKKMEYLREKISFKKPLTCKIFRVTVATSMLRANCSPREVMDMLGHSDLRTLEHYLAVVKKDLKKTHRRSLDKRLPKSDTHFNDLDFF